jgi:C1A family cysteine protease
MKRIIGFIIACGFILQIFSFFIIPVDAKFIEDTTDLFWSGNSKIDKDYNKNKIKFKEYSHLLTQDEMDQLKKRVGIYEKNKNYNIKYNGLGTGLAPPSNDEWNEMVGSINVIDSDLPILPTSSLFDLSAETYFPIVRSQGSQGSCAAWAATYYANGYIQAKNNDWNEASIGNNDHLLSPAFTYNKCNYGKDSGSHSWTNGYIMEDIGVCTWSMMPYSSSDYVSWGNENAWRDAPSYRINNVFMIDSYPANYDDNDINLIKNAVENGYPVTFALHASSYNYFGSDDVLGLNSMVSSYNHANTIVGFDDSKIDIDSGEVGAFKCVNSWGGSWGPTNDGFYWMTYAAFMGSQNVYPVCWFDDLYVENDPKLIGVWELNPNADRDAGIELGIGSYVDPINTKTPWMNGHTSLIHSYPNFMCLDISEFYSDWISGTNNFYLDFGDSLYNDGVISSFKIEYYETSYNHGFPSKISPESDDVPKNTPGYVENQLLQTDIEYPPDKPINPNPDNGLIDVEISPTLSAYVFDMNGDNMNVSFYTDSNDFIGIDFNVASGSRATIIWSDLLYDAEYRWYAISDDGKYTNMSDVWSFRTLNQAQPDTFYTNQDIIIQNKEIIGSYLNSLSSDDNYEGIKERESGGKPSNRYSYLEHKWIIPVAGGLQYYEFFIEAYHSSNSENDDFTFYYSTNNIDFTNMLTITKTSDINTYQTYSLPTSISGSVYILVKDNDQTRGNRNLDTIYIDHMYIIGSGTPPPNRVPNKPFNPFPGNGLSNIDINPTLSITVSDPDGGNLNVTFFDAFDNSEIDTIYNVESGSIASIIWPGLSYNNDYFWYVIAYDSELFNTSETWSFTTRGEIQPGGMYVWDIDFLSAGKNLKSNVIIRLDSDNDGIAELDDLVLNGAIVHYTLTHLESENLVNYVETTDSNGIINVQWKKAEKGWYEGNLSDISHNAYTYNPSMNVENPAYYEF